MRFDMTKLVPAYIRDDRNGYALCAAIQSGLEYFCNIVEDCLGGFFDVEQMDEDRLDELAQEYNCLYDFGASIELKRNWIKNAINYQCRYGTAQALVDYISAYYSNFTVEEAALYGGEAFHFSITAYGELTTEQTDWIDKAVNSAKNVRSIFDGFYAGALAELFINAVGREYNAEYRYAGDFLCGEKTVGGDD